MEQGYSAMWMPLFLLSLPGCFSIQGPESVRGVEGGSLAVQCHYGPRWVRHGKQWCQGPSWKECKVLVQTAGGSQHQAQSGDVAISDDPWARAFTVTMNHLHPDDTGTYWCIINRAGSEFKHITVTVDPATPDTPMHKRRLHSTITETPRAATSGVYTRTHYLLLGFLKVPILLLLLGIILWLRERPQEQGMEPLYVNMTEC